MATPPVTPEEEVEALVGPPVTPEQQVEALVALLDKLDTSGQDAALRAYVDRGLERMSALEQGRYRFIAECAHLAANNMQDIRLLLLEQRVDKLENPEGPTIAEMCVNAALSLAVTLAGLLLVEGVASIMLAVATDLVLTRSLRKC